MIKFVGPTFQAELAAAGVPYGVWQDATGALNFGPNITADQQATAQRVYAAHDPSALPPPTVTGNQWSFALSSLGLSSAWRIGVTKSKDSDQVRINLISRSTPLLASDPLLVRVATNAGADASGNPLITVSSVFTVAQGMPL